jgi:ABC-type antimicrobial peptide transport system permease subunit
MVALAGVILGTGCCFVITPALLRIGEIVSGHRGSGSVSFAPLVLTAAAILAFIALIAFIRARMVRKYPPVTALRKGIGDHRYGREHLELKNTKGSVHLRLAMKGFLKNFRQNLGLTLCITLASSAIVLCFVIFSFFGNDMNAISNAAGIELSDLRVEIMETGDAYAFADELADMPEVRKTVPTAGMSLILTEPDYLDYMFPVAFRDFSSAENIFPAEGRFPEHDNEVMITKMYAKMRGLKTGDSIPLECNNVRKNYVITGLVTSLTNGGGNLYITDNGMKRIMPAYRPDTIELYLNEGVDKDKFKYTLTEKYGRSIADIAQDSSEGGSYEERIKSEAEQKIADLMANYGVSHVEYAIQSGDTVIKGNSDNFIIRSIMDIGSILRTQLGGTALAIAILTTLFMVLSAFVVMVILFILMESNVRKQRKEFGIMKSMGYTSKELMFQLAARIMPAAIFSVAAGTVAAVMIIKYFTGYIGKISINIPAVIILDVILLLFCFGCAYFGARKIKKISVCELMSE